MAASIFSKGPQGYRPQPGQPEELKALDLPERLDMEWPRRFLAGFSEMLSRRSFMMFMESCVRCGACTDKCPVYLAGGDPLNMPAARADLARRIYESHFAPWSRRSWRRSGGPDETDLFEWFVYFNQCLTCRRCAQFCPLGLDPSEVTLACREIMADLGLAAGPVVEAAAQAELAGNHAGLTPAAWAEAAEELEGKVLAETGVPVRFPVDEPGAEVLFLPAAKDLTDHRATLEGCAKAFHAAGVSWTMSSRAGEAANYGFYLGQNVLKRINHRVLDEAARLRVKRIVWGECGHGWRVGRNYTDTLNGPLTKTFYPKDKRLRHVCEFFLELMEQGAFDGKLFPEANDPWSVTYHDPCHAARGANLIVPPRKLLRASVNDFKEMPEDTIRENTLCCGAGGGLVGKEASVLRLAAGAPRARAFDGTGANFLATVCDDCKTALPEVIEACLNRKIRVGGVMELFGQALTPNLSSNPDRKMSINALFCPNPLSEAKMQSSKYVKYSSGCISTSSSALDKTGIFRHPPREEEDRQ